MKKISMAVIFAVPCLILTAVLVTSLNASKRKKAKKRTMTAEDTDSVYGYEEGFGTVI